ncbi:MAG: zinc-binding dehydrogenase [Victivallales bacterium]|nr:zinc-binding dehydrogenase [Victivallales bacterium]
MPETMQAAITDGKGNLWLESVSVPVPNEYQCLCRTLVCATCTGTDKKHIHNQLPWQQEYPGILGHESIGEVIQVGRKVRAFRPGDRVIRPTAVYNGEHWAGFSSLWGGFAEYGLVTDGDAMRADGLGDRVNPYVQFQMTLPADLDISAAEASMLITLKEVAGFAESVGVGLNTPVLVLGLGSVGLSFCVACRLLGAYPVIAAARRKNEFGLAMEVGADAVVCTSEAELAGSVLELTGGKGVFRVLDGTGSPAYVETAMGALAADGKICPYAKYPKDDPLQNHVPASRLLEGMTGEVRTHGWACSACRHGLVKLDRLYSHRMPFAEIVRGFGMLERKEAFKIVFEM